MAEEGNRRCPVRLADGASRDRLRETRKRKWGKDLWDEVPRGPEAGARIGTIVALSGPNQYVKPHPKQ